VTESRLAESTRVLPLSVTEPQQLSLSDRKRFTATPLMPLSVTEPQQLSLSDRKQVGAVHPGPPAFGHGATTTGA